MEAQFQIIDNRLKVILAIQNKYIIFVNRSKHDVQQQILNLGLDPKGFNELRMRDITQSNIDYLTQKHDQLEQQLYPITKRALH